MVLQSFQFQVNPGNGSKIFQTFLWGLFIVERLQYYYTIHHRQTAPPSKNTVHFCICSSDSMQTTSLVFMKKLPDDQCFSITKDSIFHIKHVYNLLPQYWIGQKTCTCCRCLMEVSTCTMFYIWAFPYKIDPPRSVAA